MKIKSYFLLTFALCVALWSCDDELTPVEQPATISFQTTELTVSENGGANVITLSLSNTLKQQGEVIIDVSSLTDGFELAPAPTNGKLILSVSAQQETVTFSLTPVNNSAINESGNETITFTVSSVSEGLVMGEKISLHVIIADDETPATANFVNTTGTVRENGNEGIPVLISLSHPAPGAGAIKISLESSAVTYGEDYTTIPEAVNGMLNLGVENGASQVSFTVLPLNDNLFNGNRNILIKLESAEGAVSRGDNRTHAFTITDDELAGKIKGYTTGAGLWITKREFTYNLDGTLAQVKWEQSTPGTLSGEYTYHYDANGNLMKSTDNPVQETVYTWEGNRITKSERIKNDEVVEYSLFGYDEAGNVGEVAQFNKQPNGDFVMSLLFVYLYYTEGNLYKQLTYNPSGSQNEDDFILISTKTYNNYLDIVNPVPMMEIIPNKKTQLNLPQTYRVEGNGSDVIYQFSYMFDDQGRPTQRTATSGTTSEITNYQYFE